MPATRTPLRGGLLALAGLSVLALQGARDMGMEIDEKEYRMVVINEPSFKNQAGIYYQN